MDNRSSGLNRGKSGIITCIENLDKIGINTKSHKLLEKLLQENPKLEEIMTRARNETEALIGIKNWVLDELKNSTNALKFYTNEIEGRKAFEQLKWEEFAAIRILDYIDNAGREFSDLNLRGEVAVSNPIKMIWLAVTYGTGGAKPYFFKDMLELFRQFSGRAPRLIPDKTRITNWMARFPTGLDPRIIKLRQENRERVLKVIIKRIEEGKVISRRYQFAAGMSREAKFQQALEWWQEDKFHLKFAARNADDLNEMLGNSLDPDTMNVLYSAEKASIPIFVNPYYISLLHVRVPYFAIGADLAIRDYVIYRKNLVDEFGKIIAWEKEDQVKPGQPNAAGWILPYSHNIHRRYPEVAILIPDSMGRACGGLCASCQRMYEFQRGNLNFDLEKLKPGQSWNEKLAVLMQYFANDSQLRDILITGGDAFMSSDKTISQILDAIYNMAKKKKEANKNRSEGNKYAEISRVRFGTRLPVYLPQRITDNLVAILTKFKKEGSEIGIKQFVIQTHFESPMEITPEAREAVKKLLSAGWIVTNQHVLITASSRRGHNAKLRASLNSIGILPYYTFTVKGYLENFHNFATNARAVQEQLEEKIIGEIPDRILAEISKLPNKTEDMIDNISTISKSANLPFLATDRNVLNLPGVGKSLTFRVIGITRYGRRILEFDHDHTRKHSPIIKKLGKVVIIESKSISEYLDQLEEMGEDRNEYNNIFGYSLGVTEIRVGLYDYPEYNFELTDAMTNLEIKN